MVLKQSLAAFDRIFKDPVCRRSLESQPQSGNCATAQPAAAAASGMAAHICSVTADISRGITATVHRLLKLNG